MSKPELGEKLHATAQLRMERSGGQTSGESRATEWDGKYGLNGKVLGIFYFTLFDIFRTCGCV